MVASAFPLAQVALEIAEDRAAAKAREAGAGSGQTPGLGEMPFLPGQDGSSTSIDGSTSSPPASGGSSSRPDASTDATTPRADASGSMLVQQVAGAARMAGLDVAVPELPVAKLDAGAPLASALAAWIAATGAQVPPEELAEQTARANALPLGLQKDLGLLVLAAADATLLQHQALARLTPEEVAWVYTHPDVATRLAQGVDDPETRYLALLASQVDMTKSVQASLLLVQAVDATRGSLADHQARAALQALQMPELDAATASILALLTAQAGKGMSDQEKVLFAADVVATTAGIPLPAAPARTTFDAALAQLLAATGQAPDAEQLAAVQGRAAALPVDLQGAIAGVLSAQAAAVNAANPALYTSDGQAAALAGVLVAVADALPVLEKYNLYWRNAPDALRVAQWTPQARAGWAAEHAALLVSANGHPVDLVRAASILGGAGLVSVEYERLSLADAHAGLSLLAGAPVNASTRAEVLAASDLLDPAVRDAAAIMLSGALASARLQREAYEDLTADDRAFLASATGIDALYGKADLTSDELATLRRASLLAERIDQEKLAAAGAIAMRATLDARDALQGAGVVETQGAATPVETGVLAFLKRLLPFGSARAQAPTCVDLGDFGVLSTDCENDVLLRVPGPFGGGDGSFSGSECTSEFDNANRDILLITGLGSTTHTPVMGTRTTFRVDGDGFCNELVATKEIPQFGAPAAWIDLGGDDTYAAPVAVVLPNSMFQVSLHLDVDGTDVYLDPSNLFDAKSGFVRRYGTEIGHPTQGSAFGIGVAVLVDTAGEDVYNAPTRSQGFGRYGVGVLADLGSSTDSYTAKGVAQGASSDTFNLGVGLLLDSGGDDRYVTEEGGQGYGLGGVLVDLGGNDNYVNEAPPAGVPLVHLDLLPGGDLSTLDVRGNNRIWLDGPSALNPGVAIDTELVLTAGDADQDGYPDFAEFAVGTDPNNGKESPANRGTARVDAVLNDEDGDGYPTYVERILSTDPANPAQYPAGFPALPVIVLPASVVEALGTADINQVLTELGVGYANGRLNATQAYAGQTNMSGSDKIVDLRLPLQSAGTIDPACAAVLFNQTITPPWFGLGISNMLQPLNPQTAPGAAPNQPRQTCANVGYATTSPGEGNATAPAASTTGNAQTFTFSLPAGILAIGDVVDTRYAADYFLVIDIGGDDAFSNSAGGGLIAATRPPTQTSGNPASNMFVAPSLVINVDPSAAVSAIEKPAKGGADAYVNASRDYAHGALLGVLVDTAGNDVYTAGSGSQGALGGVLLDLAGDDRYDALELSQGAGLAASPSTPRSGLPNGGSAPATGVATNTTTDALARRTVPSLLADLGEGNDSYRAASSSQGFSRGFSAGTPAPQRNGVVAAGILLDQGGKDLYNTLDRQGRHAQGVGGTGALGALVDLGGKDIYYAYGPVSQGATISQLVGTAESTRPTGSAPATGVLIDLAADAESATDIYYARDGARDLKRTDARNTNLTVTRSETFTAENGANVAHVYGDLGIHLDGTRDANILDGVGGAGNRSSATLGDGFLVNLPSARLAIGDETRTTYDREYALVVDLGGKNEYEFTAAGFLSDILVATQGQPPAAAVPVSTPAPTLYPVTFLLDLNGDSTYTTTRAFSQGAAYFSVGVLADLGGTDTFTAASERLPSVRSAWLPIGPPIDAVVGSDWDGVAPITINLTAARDPTNRTPWKLRMANDGTSLYLALEGRTSSHNRFNVSRDRLTVDFDAGHRGQGWDAALGRTGIDQVSLGFSQEGACTEATILDKGFSQVVYDARKSDNAWPFWPYTLDAPRASAPAEADLEAACTSAPDGTVVFELRKRLVANDPYDRHDLAYCNDGAGWFYAKKDGLCVDAEDELGIHIQWNESSAGFASDTGSAPASFVWPEGSTDRDGDVGFTRGNGLGDEMATWAVVSLADRGQAGREVFAGRAPAFSQGAAVAGVGILAMLGGSDAASTLTAGDASQAYGNLGGLGVLLDAGGSDRYVGLSRVQGAAEGGGIALLVEFEGHDNFVAGDHAYGWVPAGQAAGSALFLELGGDDEYTWKDLRSTGANASLLAVGSPFQNDVALGQNQTGLFVDAGISSRVSQLAQGVGGVLNNARPNLRVYKHDPTADDADKNGCTRSALPIAGNSARPLAAGTICLYAEVNMSTALNAVPAVRETVSVVGMDFLVGRQRIASLDEPLSTSADGLVTKWSIPINLSAARDGVTRIKAVPIVAVGASTDAGNRSATLFRSEPPTGDFEESEWVRAVVIDNAPAIALKSAPEYRGVGDANASFSPFGIGNQHELNVSWSVSHDADEERLNVINGYAPPAWSSNLPCTLSEPERLCHLLPFYLTVGESERLSTNPGVSSAGPRTVPETAGGDKPYGRKTDTLNTSLRILLEDSFHLAIPGRAAIAIEESTYFTNVQITLENAQTGEIVLDQSNRPWMLHNGTYDSRQGSVNLDQVRRIVRDNPVVKTAVDTTESTLEGLRGNLVANTIDVALEQLCGSNTVTNATGANKALVCDQLTGDYGAFTVRLCRRGAPGVQFEAAHTAGKTIDGAVNNTGRRFCGPMITQELNATADQADALVGPQLGEMLSPVIDTLFDSDTGSEGGSAPGSDGNWTDFYFSANRSLPPAKWGIAHSGDGRELVIPAGYRVRLAFSVTTTGLNGATQSVADVASDPLMQAASLIESTNLSTDGECITPTPGAPPVLRPGCPGLIELEISKTLAAEVRARRQTLEGVDALKDLRTVPAAVFFVGGGDPRDQPRLEMRVPTEPSTMSSVVLERLDGSVAYVMSGESLVEGDIDGSPTRDGFRPIPNHTTVSSWTVGTGERFTQRHALITGDVVEDGLYRVVIRAADGSHKDEKQTVRSDVVIVDKTPPVTYITTPEFAGSAIVRNNQLPIRWVVDTSGVNNVPGTGLRNTTLFVRSSEEGDLSNMSTWSVRFFNNSRVSMEPKGDSDVYLVIAISLDQAGNLEGLSTEEALGAANFSQALSAAFNASVARGVGSGPGMIKRIVVDQGRPVASAVDIDGGRSLNYLGTDVTFLRAGSPVAFTVCAGDGEVGVANVEVQLDHVDPATKATFGGLFPATSSSGCATGQGYTYDGWDEVNANRTLFPEGIWDVRFIVRDAAGNKLTVPGGTVVLDHTAPNVTALAPVLPLGQSAVKPGDRVSLRLAATDAFGVDEPRITVDASALTNETGLTTHPARVDGVIYQEVTFTVNRANLQNQVYTVNVTVPDQAGHLTIVPFHVAVDFKKFSFVEGSFRVTDVMHNSAVLRWNTTEPTSGAARFGTSTASLNGRTPLDTTATREHAVKIEGLAASTRYYVRAVSTSPSGFTLESDVLELDTASALVLNITSPARGQSVSGSVPIQWKGGLLDSSGFVTYTIEVQSAADKPWTFLTTLTRQGQEHQVAWNTTRFLDGTAYRFRITAEAGRDLQTRTSGPITLDNTPPSVTVLSPLIATNDTTPRIVAEARDALSGLDATAATLLIDGVPVQGGVLSDALPDGGIRVSYDVPSALPAGVRTFELRVPDRAGATARESWKVAIDGDAPNATVNANRYAPGTAAAKLGGTVTLNLTLKDASGVASAVADVSQINRELGTVRLVKLVGTDTWQATVPVLAIEPSATKRVSVNATDLAGNWRLVAIDVPVDNVAPSVPSATVRDAGHTSATIDAAGDEPILLNVTATARDSPAVTAASREAVAAATLKVDGLLPSRTYQYTLTATDRAGNAVTLLGSFQTKKDEKAPTAVGPLSVLDFHNGTLRLSWAPARDDVAVAGYRVYRSEDGTTFQAVAEVKGTSHDDAGLPFEKSYLYKVAALDYGGNEGPAEERLRASATAVPSLSAGLATPTIGSTQTVFRYTVTYVSAGGVAPATIRIILDGVPQDMKLLSGDPKTGAVYVYETRLAPHKRDEPHTYAFEATDGRYTVRFPEDGSVLRGPLVSSEIDGETGAAGLANFAQRVPLGGAALTGIAVLAAVGAAALLMRRKKEGSK